MTTDPTSPRQRSAPDVQPVQLVWFKRDLRLEDHAALASAAERGPVICLYVHEPELLSDPTTHAAHLVFINQALAELDEGLRARGGALTVRVGALPEVFEQLWRECPFTRLWSHEETGLGITWTRDKRVAHWARERGVVWTELPNHGVFRPHPQRDGWATRWRRRMAEPLTPAPEQLRGVPGLPSVGLPAPAELGVAGSPRPEAVAGGSRAGAAVLADFLGQRSRSYQADISSPVTAWSSSSRLSPHLAWGTLSMRQVYQHSQRRAQWLKADGDAGARAWARSVDSFLKRIYWHCHFIQKLEDEPALEYRNLSRACDGLRDEEPNEELLGPWREGRTGYPMVDACMRALHAGGWINFRMRAMLTSFVSYHLWQHWRAPALHLARLFLDFEPGIHFSQIQMQSGTTGINAVRIYSPVKQVQDHDPQGVFIRRWCPELAGVPDEFLARPETMPALTQQMAGCRIGQDYPAPIVENGKAYMAARWRMQRLRNSGAARQEAGRIYQRHGSRKRPRGGGGA